MRIGGFIGSAVLALVVGVASPAAAADAPEVGAKSAYVVDSAGTIHFGKRETRRVPVASLVKVMTAYVVLREAELSDTITITATDVKHATSNGATTAALKKGERLTVRDLLYGLMLPSGADAANALARRYGPGKTAFVAKMNRAARALGLSDTRYTNPDGLPTPGNGGYSTAVDQVKLAERALDDSTFAAVTGAKVHKVAKTALHRAHTWRNSNKLLSRADGVLGVKTGYTRAAGYCLLFAGERGGKRVVGVLLGDQNERRFETAERLLDYAGEQIAGG
ncbi:D-alanyl-D-alanine carboxypeptidase family protein [Nonomuraea angiospora]|uniref:D-alanyl-D-alanine carboxypeptidase (Penicillin-binding protein 5/6) n=1 Tax=Nonomuraea angiospora TaxID=46172 RepID=A0ABR9M1N8_9ACTN|nr:serine hydrolase [Nonomuraea angiospora]MBE1586836.1 D-alanyl-D-alanine carboxypeptidase (penicillin-binding protein 5/6) [Nonomuraea angiospora]